MTRDILKEALQTELQRRGRQVITWTRMKAKLKHYVLARWHLTTSCLAGQRTAGSRPGWPNGCRFDDPVKRICWGTDAADVMASCNQKDDPLAFFPILAITISTFLPFSFPICRKKVPPGDPIKLFFSVISCYNGIQAFLLVGHNSHVTSICR